MLDPVPAFVTYTLAMTWRSFDLATNLTCSPAVLADGVVAWFDQAHDRPAYG